MHASYPRSLERYERLIGARRPLKRAFVCLVTLAYMAYLRATRGRVPVHVRFLAHYLFGRGEPMRLAIASAFPLDRQGRWWEPPRFGDTEEAYYAVGKFVRVGDVGMDYYAFYPCYLATRGLGWNTAFATRERHVSDSVAWSAVVVLPAWAVPAMQFLADLVFGKGAIVLDRFCERGRGMLVNVVVTDTMFMGTGTPFLTTIEVGKWRQ